MNESNSEAQLDRYDDACEDDPPAFASSPPTRYFDMIPEEPTMMATVTPCATTRARIMFCDRPTLPFRNAANPLNRIPAVTRPPTRTSGFRRLPKISTSPSRAAAATALAGPLAGTISRCCLAGLRLCGLEAVCLMSKAGAGEGGGRESERQLELEGTRDGCGGFAGTMSWSAGRFGGDPRREDRIEPYKHEQINEEDVDPEWKALLSIACGIGAMVMKNHNLSWFAFFSSISAMASMDYPEHNMKQATTALMFSLSGLLTSYIKLHNDRIKGGAAAAV